LPLKALFGISDTEFPNPLGSPFSNLNRENALTICPRASKYTLSCMVLDTYSAGLAAPPTVPFFTTVSFCSASPSSRCNIIFCSSLWPVTLQGLRCVLAPLSQSFPFKPFFLFNPVGYFLQASFYSLVISYPPRTESSLAAFFDSLPLYFFFFNLTAPADGNLALLLNHFR